MGVGVDVTESVGVTEFVGEDSGVNTRGYGCV